MATRFYLVTKSQALNHFRNFGNKLSSNGAKDTWFAVPVTVCKNAVSLTETIFLRLLSIPIFASDEFLA